MYYSKRDYVELYFDTINGCEPNEELKPYENSFYELMSKYGFDLSKYVIKPDTSLYHGYEVVTPILNKDNVNFEEISYICDIIKDNSKVGAHASSHIHVGAHTLNNTKEVITRLILLLCAYENILYRLTEITVKWVLANPNPIPLEKVEYFQ